MLFPRSRSHDSLTDGRASARRRSRLRPLGLAFTALAIFVAACGGSPEVVVDGNDDDGGGEGNDGNATGGGLNVDGGAGEPNEPEPEVPWTCGDGDLEPGEFCDDGNEEDGDGCSGDCQTQDPDYECVPGEECELTVVCGNGTREGDEECDDGGTDEDPADGCSAECEVDDGFVCTKPGEPCVAVPECGNGVRERGETCDAGPSSDPGCPSSGDEACQKQDGYWCPTPGLPCIAEVCGNGIRTPGEVCDTMPNVAGDGCAANCLGPETGFVCTSLGCRAICGDNLKHGDEECDLGANNGSGGCTTTCRIKPGFSCNLAGTVCTAATCGNSITEAGEGCDVGPTPTLGNGCGPTCQVEPTVTVGTDPQVQIICGDGLLSNGEDCDDGNVNDDDGCTDCEVDEGFECDDTISYPSSVRMKVVYRDFRQRDQQDTGGHPHMRRSGVAPPADGTDRRITGTVCTTANGDSCGRLDANGKPDLETSEADPTVTGGLGNDSLAFDMWYRDSNTTSVNGLDGNDIVVQNMGNNDYLTLTRSGTSAANYVYTFDSSSFFPLNGRGFGNTPGQSNNFHFTTELRYFFVYQGGEELLFRGDDDVWVYVNGRLAVDIGGIHGPEWGRVILGDEDSTCSVSTQTDTQPAACDATAGELADNTDGRFGLTKGNLYEIVLFHAERHPGGSNFRLTLAGFLAPRSSCTAVCGDEDAHVAPGEVCDDGPDNEDDVYGVCSEDCTSITFCGDGDVQGPSSSPVAGPEFCDNGFNLDTYRAFNETGKCGPGCMPPPYCGDASVQAANEDCDEGTVGNTGEYGGCDEDCSWGPYCGDGEPDTDDGETCDDGYGEGGNVDYADGPGSCGYDCQEAPYCGDGVRNGPEACDEGEDNDGSYGGCEEDCTLAPRCGDRVTQENEQCDDGPIGSLSCSSTCKKRQVVPR